ncbi:hypothetical protein V1509DRAFT_649495 [Lipomyces kononenkoae]
MISRFPVIIIVPGSLHKPIHYRKIAEPVRARGYEIITHPVTPSLVVCGDDYVDPATTHLDDAAEIRRNLLPVLEEGKQAIVISHSYGSLPATGSKGGIISVIIIAGFVFPSCGKSIMDDDKEPLNVPYHIVENGVSHLQESAKALFFSDMSPEEADTVWANLFKKQSRKSFTTFPQ